MYNDICTTIKNMGISDSLRPEPAFFWLLMTTGEKKNQLSKQHAHMINPEWTLLDFSMSELGSTQAYGGLL